MKKLIALILLVSVNAYAGKVKLTWLQSPADSAGNPVQLEKFTVYWGYSSTTLANTIDIGPPAPAPWRYEPNGYGRYSKTLENANWGIGQNICFAMTASTSTLSSGLSNIVCHTMSGGPMAPDIVDLDQIP